MNKRAPNFINRIGNKYGKLTVISFLESKITKDRKYIVWTCKCDCGNICNIIGEPMVAGRIKSCGCLLNNPKGRSKGYSGLVEFYSAYKSSSKNGKLEFELSLDFFEKITSSNCKYCGEEPKKEHIHRRKGLSNKQIEHITYLGNGIDRINNTIGYIESNCVPCCEWCNRMKLTKSAIEFIEHCIKISNNYKDLTKIEELKKFNLT